MRKAFVLLTALAFGSTAFAEADLNPNVYNPPAKAPTGAMNETNIPKAGTGTSTINPGSKQGQASQSSGAGTNAAVGAALIATGTALLPPPTTPTGAALIAMGILALMQSAEDKKAARESAATGAASQTNGGGAGTNPVDGKGSGGFNDPKIKDGMAKLAAAGYKMSEKGLTHPDGSFTPSSSFNSPGAMSAAGIDPAAISEAQKIVAGAEGMDGAKISSVGVNSGGGGGGDSSGVSEGDSNGESASGPAFGNPFGMDAAKRASLVAGKTVMFDGEPIGVRGQNIFDMVHNCYQKKRQGKQFIESEHDVVTRSPASARPNSK